MIVRDGAVPGSPGGALGRRGNADEAEGRASPQSPGAPGGRVWGFPWGEAQRREGADGLAGAALRWDQRTTGSRLRREPAQIREDGKWRLQLGWTRPWTRHTRARA